MKKILYNYTKEDVNAKYKGINHSKLIEFLNKNNITEIYIPEHKSSYNYKYVFIANNELIILILDSAWKRIHLEIIEREFIKANIIIKKEEKTTSTNLTFF